MIELLISIVIIAVLSVAIAVNLSRGALKANFDNQLVEIVHVLEQARSYSLTNFLIEDPSDGSTEPADYYLITVTSAGVRLDAYGPTLDFGLENVVLDDGFSIDAITGSEYAFYFPPEGEICFVNPSCPSGTTEISFTVVDSSGTYSSQITLNIYGGYPEVESL